MLLVEQTQSIDAWIWEELGNQEGGQGECSVIMVLRPSSYPQAEGNGYMQDNCEAQICSIYTCAPWALILASPARPPEG